MSDDNFDPGATLCGHGDRTQRAHYLGGGLWVCFECLTKLLLGDRAASASVSDQAPVARHKDETMTPTVSRRRHRRGAP